MSALPPKADMFSIKIDVCLVPKADIPHRPGEVGSRAILMAKNNQASAGRMEASGTPRTVLAQRVAATVFHQERCAGGKSRA